MELEPRKMSAEESKQWAIIADAARKLAGKPSNYFGHIDLFYINGDMCLIRLEETIKP